MLLNRRPLLKQERFMRPWMMTCAGTAALWNKFWMMTWYPFSSSIMETSLFWWERVLLNFLRSSAYCRLLPSVSNYKVERLLFGGDGGGGRVVWKQMMHDDTSSYSMVCSVYFWSSERKNISSPSEPAKMMKCGKSNEPIEGILVFPEIPLWGNPQIRHIQLLNSHYS